MSHLVKIDINTVLSESSALLTAYARTRLNYYASNTTPDKTLRLAKNIFSNDKILNMPRSSLVVAMVHILLDTTQDVMSSWLVPYTQRIYNILSNNYTLENDAVKVLLIKEMGLCTNGEKIVLACAVATSIISSVVTASEHNQNIIFTPGAILLIQELEAPDVKDVYTKLGTFIDTGSDSFYPLIMYLCSYFSCNLAEIFEIPALIVLKTMSNNVPPADKAYMMGEFDAWVQANITDEQIPDLVKAISLTMQVFYDTLAEDALQP